MPGVASSDQTAERLRRSAHVLSGASRDYDPLLRLIGDAKFVLLGEASHGTHEFYSARAEITKRLVLEKGFTTIVWEADWPDAARVDRYVRCVEGDTADRSADLGSVAAVRKPSAPGLTSRGYWCSWSITHGTTREGKAASTTASAVIS